MKVNATTQGAALVAPDRVDDSWSALQAFDVEKVRMARAAFPLLQGRRAKPRDWHDALAWLELYASALAAWDHARAIADALDLLFPHASLACALQLERRF
jgi:hypothetical protein